MIVADYLNYLDKIAPFSKTGQYNDSGLLVGGKNDEVKAVMLCLDASLDVIQEANKKGANLIISHHPIIFNPLKKAQCGTPVYEAVKHGINVISVHSNFDFFVMSEIMLALLGFPLKGETLAPETPDGNGFGLIVDLPEEITAVELLNKTKQAFQIPVVRYTKAKESIKRIAVCSGSGGDFLYSAIEKNCDAYITGDVKHHQFVDSKNAGFMLIDAGHYGTERIMCGYLADKLSEAFPSETIYVSQNECDVQYLF